MEWPLVRLDSLYNIARGGSPRPIKKFITDDPNGINWIKIGDATASGKYIFETKEKIIPEGIQRSRFVKKGDFILSNSMSFGRPYIMGTTGCIHDGWLVLSAKDDSIDQDFLYHILGSPLVFQQFDSLAAGSTVRNLNIDLVSGVKMPLLPLKEQKRIVAILDQAFADIEQARAKTEQNLKNARELFESKKVNLFEKLSIKANLMPLPSVCNNIFAGGDAPKKGLYSKEKTETFCIPIYANAVKQNGLYGYTDYSRANEPSITISARGSGTGHIELRKEPFLPIVRLIVLTPNKDIVDLEFLKHALQTLDILRSGSAIPQLTVPMIKEYSIPVPSLDVQQTTVDELELLKESIGRVERVYKEKTILLEELKKSILQKAFSGELSKEKEGAVA
ncbi:restriction endonuclease subunit S [Pseudoalteromonas sp. MMG007]|uniref:restriction endonuclease subunit S n=1 Tax=Pseudoalteromonas sp. MMG007 TaxID=2822684 RepID=UPI001FFC64AC|nr:restriction endonuclease subunit S [Pseudoalteromonas sp. MMG007]